MSTQALQGPIVSGGQTAYHALTPNDQKNFNEAFKGFVGVTYTPIAVSVQIVNGTNYRFKYTASIPPSEVEWKAIVEIFEPLEGKAHVTGITRI